MLVFYVVLASLVAAAGYVILRMFAGNITIFAATALVSLLVPWPVYGISTAIAKNDQQTFHEYWNGYETAATSQSVTCQRDGVCHHEYNCDPYTETEHYIDSEGKQKSRQVTKYHRCPYSTEETSYYVDSTIGSFTIASHLMTGPQFRDRAIPGGQVTTPPVLWTEAKKRLDSGKPGPVTQVNDYKNYILASDRSLFKRYSDQIEDLVEDNLLPAPVAGVKDVYQAPKAYFVNLKMKGLDQKVLTRSVAYLNGAVGDELHGDLHVVFVNSNIGDPTDYSNSVMAYWQNAEFHGKDAISKNSIVVVVGVEKHTPVSKATSPVTNEITENLPVPVDGILPSTTPSPEPEVDQIAKGTPVVAWAKAFTGMPVGNEAMLTQIESDLKGKPVNGNLIGSPAYDVAKEAVVHSDGALENILFGSNKFERVSMTADDAEDNGSGFSYLGEEWEPDEGTMILIFVISSILFAIVFAFGSYMSYTMNRHYSTDPIYGFFKSSKK